MKINSIFNIIAFPITLIVLVITSACVIPYALYVALKYRIETDDKIKIFVEIVFKAVENFPLMFIWTKLPLLLRAIISASIIFYIFK